MAKIIEVRADGIAIGMDDGSISQVPSAALNFVPHIGDEVEVFQGDSKLIVSKVERNQQFGQAPININMNQIQNQSGPIYAAGKVVNKVVYALLAIFLGGFGIHKFYAGKGGTGVLYLLFCWTGIPSIIAFIEGILALLKPADANGNIVV